MNWFIITAGILYIGAGIHSWCKGEKVFLLVWICYAVANFALAYIEFKKSP